MGLSGFICLDGEMVGTDDCLSGCRMSNWLRGRHGADRCVSRAMLETLRSRHESYGPAIYDDDCLRGPLPYWLKRRSGFYLKPSAKPPSRPYIASEHCNISVEEVDIRSQVCYDPMENAVTLHQSVGSYRAIQILGLKMRRIPDPSGKKYKRAGSYKLNGRTVKYKAGDPKTVTQAYTDHEAADTKELELLLNFKRLALERERGRKPCMSMNVELVVRDAGLQATTRRGLYRGVYLIGVQHLPVEQVINYFTHKAQEIEKAMKLDDPPRPCNDMECWGGNKCDERWCIVASVCPFRR